MSPSNVKDVYTTQKEIFNWREEGIFSVWGFDLRSDLVLTLVKKAVDGSYWGAPRLNRQVTVDLFVYCTFIGDQN